MQIGVNIYRYKDIYKCIYNEIYKALYNWLYKIESGRDSHRTPT